MLDAARRLTRPPVIAGDCDDADGAGPADFRAAGWIPARWTIERLAEQTARRTGRPGDRHGRPPAAPRLRVRPAEAWTVVDAEVLATADRFDWFAERSDHLPVTAVVQRPQGALTSMSERNGILLDKIRKLLAMAEGTDNANEAEAFSAKAAQLIASIRIDLQHVRGALDRRGQGCAG